MAGNEATGNSTGTGPVSRYTRRQALTRAAGLGLTVPAVSGLHWTGASAAPRRSTSSLISSAQDVAQLEFYHDKSGWQDYFAAMSDLSAEEIQVSFEPIPYSDTTSYQQVINSSLPTSDPPDIFTWWSGFRMEDMYNSGNLLDVTDIWESSVANGDLPASMAAAFTFNDRQFGLPLTASYWVTFYNKRLFAEHGLEPPQTWDDLMAIAETLKSAGVAPFYATVGGRWPSFIWWQEFLIKQDPQFYVDLCEGRANYTDDVAVQALEIWRGMIEAEYFTDLDVPMDAEGAGMFQNGEIGMVPIGTWFQQQFIAVGMTPGEDYDAFLLPNINPDLDKNVAIVETGAICMPASPTNEEASRALGAWWVQEGPHTAWTAHLGDSGANPKVVHSNATLTSISNQLNEGNYELLQRYWEATPPQIVENAVDELARFMLNPDQGQSVLEAIQQIADEEWSRRAG